jgi:murein L,D-transpeptidase YafK
MTVARRAFQAALLLTALLLAGLALYRAPIPVPTPPEPDPPALTGQIDRILVDKSDRTLTVFRAGQPLRSYPVALGFQPVGDKVREGDGKTPEGLFRINRRNAASRFHLSLGIDYPQVDDRARAVAGGYSPGGEIFIHGQPNGMPADRTIGTDWTAGCIALSDARIEEIWRITPDGTVVEIRP